MGRGYCESGDEKVLMYSAHNTGQDFPTGANFSPMPQQRWQGHNLGSERCAMCALPAEVYGEPGNVGMRACPGFDTNKKMLDIYRHTIPVSSNA